MKVIYLAFSAPLVFNMAVGGMGESHIHGTYVVISDWESEREGEGDEKRCRISICCANITKAHTWVTHVQPGRRQRSQQRLGKKALQWMSILIMFSSLTSGNVYQNIETWHLSACHDKSNEKCLPRFCSRSMPAPSIMYTPSDGHACSSGRSTSS